MNQPSLNFSQELTEQLLLSMAIGIYTLDLDGNCTYINDQVSQILGWSSEELLDKNIHEKIHSQTATGQFLSREDCPTYKSIQQGKIFYSENEVFKHKSGELTPVLIISEPVYDGNEKTGSVTIFKDISISKNVETELYKAKKQVANINQLKNNFLANMSHELRTPLNAILGLTQLTLQTDLSSNQQSYLEKIDESSNQLSLMINNILDLSKIDSGQMELATSSFNINSLFGDLRQQFNAEAKANNLDLIFTIDPAVVLNRYGDPSKIKKVLMSLIQNALKFTHAGQIILTATLDPNKNRANSKHIIFNVTDTGIGISEDQMKDLFTDFTQADSSASRKYEGLGLGLTYSKKLVELMHGEIGVNSTLNEGSHFYIKLKLDVAEDLSTQNKNIPIQASTILVAEDNKINQTIVKNLLTKRGCKVEICENGQQAIDQVIAKDYTLVLMDIQMPIMDGIEATIQIRKKEKFKNLPIIALTGNTSEEEKQACLDSGMNDFLSKPIKPDNLISVLKKWSNSFSNIDENQPEIHPADASDIITEVEGVDMQQGLQRLANNKTLYKQLLNDFCLYYVNYDQKIIELLEVKNFDEAERFAHSIKGVAGNIGAVMLANSSDRLEKAIKLDMDTSGHFKEFKLTLDQLHISLNESGYGLRSKVALHTNKQKTKTISASSKLLLNNLKQKLQVYDGDSEDVFNQNFDELSQSYDEEDLHQLRSTIQRFSFDDALLIIEKLLIS